MIISHEHKFIFIKPTKVAGTSVEVALAKYCGEKDIITNLTNYSEKYDEDQYVQLARNCDGYYNHMCPDEIREKIGDKVWESYYKFSIVRNPWDQVVSRFHWEQTRKSYKKSTKKGLLPRIFFAVIQPFDKRNKSNPREVSNEVFSDFVENFRENWTNTRFYFDVEDNPICDFFIRYENLQQDYKKVCKRLRIPFESLPRLKSKTRPASKHYSLYYDKDTKKKVETLFGKEILYFSYTF